MSALKDRTVLIIGLGLIGGSVARALREKALCRCILACGRDPVPLRQAQADGVVDEWSTDMAAMVARADIVLIAVPTCTVRRVLETIHGSLRPDAIVTDAASVKGSVVDDARQVLGERSGCFVPAHPIAGSEHSGYAASMADLYAGRKVIVTPLPENPAPAVEAVVALWQGIGAEVHRMAVDTHDSVLAATSHLPHLLAYSLVNTLAGLQEVDDVFRFAAGGFAGFTRIASSDPVMWRDIFLTNGPATVAKLDAFSAELARMRQALVEQDGEFMKERFDAARNSRNAFINKHFSESARASDNPAPVVTIDGPSGSGKGTVSARIASILGWHFLDSGALYRLLGLAAVKAGVSTADEESLLPLVTSMQIRFGPEEGAIWLDGEEVSADIRHEAGGALASQVAVHPRVRTALLGLQRGFRQPPGLVADGRDMGTVVFPDATAKVFLTASAEERAKRRYKQLIDKGIDVNLSDLFVDIQARDERDTNRSASPLRPAADAVVVDTTATDVEQVVTQVLELVRQRLQTPGT